jgi:DNA-binding FadR family transcriptional regulator
MKLTRLKGNTLRVYLVLVEERQAGDQCPLSQRALSRQVRLSRNTVRAALTHLESRGLIVPQRQGWWVRTEPLEWLLPPWRDETEANDVPAPAGSWN